MSLIDVWQTFPDPDKVSDAFGGGMAGFLAVCVVFLAGVVWLTINARLKDAKEVCTELKTERTTLIGKLDALTTAVERQTGIIDGLSRELERRGRTR